MHWMKSLNAKMRDTVERASFKFVEKLATYFSDLPSYKSTVRQCVPVTTVTMTITFTKIITAFLSNVDCDVTNDARIEKIAGFAAFLAFGCTVDSESRNIFTAWWNEEWPDFFGDENPWEQFYENGSFVGCGKLESLPGGYVQTPHCFQVKLLSYYKKYLKYLKIILCKK